MPAVFVYDGVTNGQISAFFAFPPALGTGVNVAVADVFGTGRPQVVATLATLPVPVVAMFDLDGTMTSFFFAPGVVGNGMQVTTADINGDGASDLVLGAGHGSTHVSIMSGRNFALLDDFYAFSPYGASGVSVG